MIDLQRATTGATLTLDNTKTVNSDLEKQFDDIVDRLLTKDLEYSEDDVEGSGKEEQELEEDLASLEPAPLELEEMSDMHEDLTQLQSPPELDTSSILTLPTIATGDVVTPVRRSTMRRRRSEDQDENAANATDAGESDAVMTYL